MAALGNLVNGVCGNEINSFLQGSWQLGRFANRVASFNGILDKLFTRLVNTKEQGLSFTLAGTGNRG
jgi:hypothetical protein